jgi:hypothetical protein
MNINKSTKVGDIVRFGDYDWRVLDVQDDKALLLSEKIIEMREYNYDLVDITWETCTLRKYLNESFYNSFNVDDKKAYC